MSDSRLAERDSIEVPGDKLAQALRADARKFVDRLLERAPTPVFELRIGWAKNYDDLLSERFEVVGNEQTVLKAAFNRHGGGRVLVSGRGGAGKSLMLHRLMRTALDQEALVVLINLSQWTGADYLAWERLGPDDMLRTDFLLRRFAAPPATAATLDSVSANTRKVFFVDGLSEIRSATGADVVNTCDTLVRDLVGAAVIITDRMVRRDLQNPDRWSLGLLLPLQENEIKRELAEGEGQPLDDSKVGILQLPFFLDALIRDGAIANTGTGTLSEYFREHAKLNTPEMISASEAALAVYASSGARTFPLPAFAEIAGRAATDKLLSSGLIRLDDGIAHFDHHLHHDFLASNALSRDSDRWRASTFDVVSLKASSFDTIAMTLELLARGMADRFVRQVYDWNPYAAGYAMAEGRNRGDLRVSAEMELMVLAMLALRRWEPVLASRQRAADALRGYPSKLAGWMLGAANLEALNALVDEMARVWISEAPPPWFEHWSAVFVTPAGTVASDNHVESLRDPDSVIGWTFANVLKRMQLSDGQIGTIRKIGRSEDVAISWRAVHVLGAFPSRKNVRFLLTTWDRLPVGSWVRYGAIRSLIEMAARGAPPIRKRVVTGIVERADQLIEDRQSLAELERAVLVAPELAPKDWAAAVFAMLRVTLVPKVGSSLLE